MRTHGRATHFGLIRADAERSEAERPGGERSDGQRDGQDRTDGAPADGQGFRPETAADPGTGSPGGPTAGARSLRSPRDVDADVAGAVVATARAVLDARVGEAAAVDTLFARDIAARVRDFALGGGGRTRSRLLWWGMRACGGGTEVTDAALRLGTALELIQTCALIHDDVMDGSPLRRGRPAVHVQLAARAGTPPDAGFGVSAAVLAGDLALAWADDTVAATRLEPDTRDRVDALWRALRTEMVAGQYLDLYGQATGSRSATHAVRTACLKSALYSVERPLALGAALAGADGATTAALCAAGRAAGTAFQLRDDLLGVFGDPAVTGKPSGEDVREGKPTYLVAVARDLAEAAGDRAALDLLDTAVGDRGLTEDVLDRVRVVLVRTGARDAVERRAARLATEAERHLAAAPLAPGPARELLLLLRRAAGVGAPHPPGHPALPTTGR
ncbi:polyprenyl synthetase family protein [uncultured Streptomyces sp.]|uniref:polyprenyl synthetase family protein n=1 Tax=uncultured Streptomyces sp. TaxID=174707 RepID=UPI00261CB3AA|nr:polyprenyl synthetase family protein [uncultured Streptomyces sp.]